MGFVDGGEAETHVQMRQNNASGPAGAIFTARRTRQAPPPAGRCPPCDVVEEAREGACEESVALPHEQRGRARIRRPPRKLNRSGDGWHRENHLSRRRTGDEVDPVDAWRAIVSVDA
jgi:hypothetical protein